jgi:hypothetical protein
VPDVWVPGFAGPLDELIARIHNRIEQFAAEAGVDRAVVEVELADGVRYSIESLSPEPGYGFVTLCPHAGDGVPNEVIVPVGSIRRLELSKAGEERGRLGFSLPASA